MKHTKYSERGPVWVAVPYETTDECAPESRIAWRVQDLDDSVIAWDCSQQHGESIAESLNALAGIPDPSAALKAAREALEWTLEQAEDWRGSLTGSNLLDEYDENLAAARTALDALKGEQS